MERRSERKITVTSPRSGTVVDARMSLALWLRAGRAERGMSLDDVARVTKIQPRILLRLEAGTIEPGDGMPADVFVRGFVRSFAKCVGLDEREALRRYTAITSGAVVTPAPVTARAMVEAMADLAPEAARAAAPGAPAPAAPSEEAPEVLAVAPVAEQATASTNAAPIQVPARISEQVIAIAEPVVPSVEPAVEASSEPAVTRKKRGRRGGKGRSKRKSMATGTPFEPTPVVTLRAVDAHGADAAATIAATPEAAASVVDGVAAPADEPTPVLEPVLDPLVEIPADLDEGVVAQTWQPKMPPAAAPTPSVPWRRPAYAMSKARAVPTLVIDDADPESAEQVLEERDAAKSVTTLAQRRSFLPPILLDREDRSARQGGLTLAVIILLIAATLTLSYLMRRPSSSGDGVTHNDPSESVELSSIG